MMHTTHAWNARIRAYFTGEGISPLSSKENVRLHTEGILGSGIDTTDHTVPSGYRPAEDDTIRVHFDALAPNQDRITAMFYDSEVATIAYIARRLSNLHPRHVIEAGCGTGSTLAFFAAAFPKVSFTGYDISPEMVHRADARVHAHGFENTSLIVARHGEAPKHIAASRADVLFSKCSFDAGTFPVFNFDTGTDQWELFIQHDPTMAHWRETFTAFRTLLRSDGWYFHVGNNCAGGIRMLVDVARRSGFRYLPRRSRVLPNGDTAPSSLRLRTLERFGREYGICEPFNCALVFRKES